MNRKFLFIIIGITVVGLLGYSLFLAWRASQGEKEGALLLTGQQGARVEVKDFLANNSQTFDYGAVIAETEQFSIVYFSEDEGILITLTQKPLFEAQVAAEAELLEQLGVGREQACELKAYESVPINVDEAASGQNYPLSFCPGGNNF